MRRTAFLVLLFLSVPLCARAEFPEKVTIGDKTIECRTVEEIRKLGFECEDVPWKDNAARVYIEAMKVYVEPSRKTEDRLLAISEGWGKPEDAKDVEKFFEDNRAALDLLRTADGMPSLAFPMQRSP